MNIDEWLKQRQVNCEYYKFRYKMEPIDLAIVYDNYKMSYIGDKQIGSKVIHMTYENDIQKPYISINILFRGMLVSKITIKGKCHSSITPQELLTYLFIKLDINQKVTLERFRYIRCYATSKEDVLTRYIMKHHSDKDVAYIYPHKLKRKHNLCWRVYTSKEDLQELYTNLNATFLIPVVLLILFYHPTSYFYILPEELRMVILDNYDKLYIYIDRPLGSAPF